MPVNIQVEPYQQERYRKRGKIKLYYIGVQFHKDHEGDPPPVNIKTMPIPFPRLGEYIEIDEVYGRDLTQKSRYQQKPVYLSERDGGADVAALIKQALADGTPLADFDLNKIKARHEVKQMSDEDLLDVLRERKQNIDPAVLRELLGETKPSKMEVVDPVEPAQEEKVSFKPKKIGS